MFLKPYFPMCITLTYFLTGCFVLNVDFASGARFQLLGRGCCVGPSGVLAPSLKTYHSSSVAKCKTKCRNEALCGAFNFFASKTAEGRIRDCVLLTWDAISENTDSNRSCRCYRMKDFGPEPDEKLPPQAPYDEPSTSPTTETTPQESDTPTSLADTVSNPSSETEGRVMPPMAVSVDSTPATRFQLLESGCCLGGSGQPALILRPPDGTISTVSQCKVTCQNEPMCGAFNFVVTRTSSEPVRDCILLSWDVIPERTDTNGDCRCYRARDEIGPQQPLAKALTAAPSESMSTAVPSDTPTVTQSHGPTAAPTESDTESDSTSSRIQLLGRGCCVHASGEVVPTLRETDATVRTVPRCRATCQKDPLCGAFNFIVTRTSAGTTRACVLLPSEISADGTDENEDCRCYRTENTLVVSTSPPSTSPTAPTAPEPSALPTMTATASPTAASIVTSTGLVEQHIDNRTIKFDMLGVGCCTGAGGQTIPLIHPSVEDVDTIQQCKQACQSNRLCGAFNFINARTPDTGRVRECVLLTADVAPESTDTNDACRCYRPRSSPFDEQDPGVTHPTEDTVPVARDATDQPTSVVTPSPSSPPGTCVPPVAHPHQAPSIVFLLADDLGFADLGVYGGPYADTPNLDRLAAQGTRFTRAYVAAVVCSPSRAALMSGRFYRSINPSMQHVNDRGFGSLPTMTSLLKLKGYHTYHVGKWHIGPSVVNGTYGIDGIFTEGLNDGESKDAGRLAKVAEVLEECAQHKEPCFINSWGRVPHFTVNPPDFAVERFRDIDVDESRLSVTVVEKLNACGPFVADRLLGMRKYLAEVWAMDRAIGRVLQKIDDLCMTDSTLVIFSSDHGAAPVQTGDNPVPDDVRRCNMMGDPGPFRGGKHEISEGGVRVPFIARWPGRITAGRVDTVSEISFVDMLPTLASLAGYTHSEIGKLKLDGYNVSSAILSESFHPLPARTTPLIWCVRDSNATVLDGPWKMNLIYGRGVELYNIDLDTEELHNILDSAPTIVAGLEEKVALYVNRLLLCVSE